MLIGVEIKNVNRFLLYFYCKIVLLFEGHEFISLYLLSRATLVK